MRKRYAQIEDLSEEAQETLARVSPRLSPAAKRSTPLDEHATLLTVALKEKHRRLINKAVENGGAKNRSDAVRQALESFYGDSK